MKKSLCIVLLLFLISCSEKYNKVSEMKVGDVVSFKQSNDYCIAKILGIDSNLSSVSIYFYKQKFINRPDSNNYNDLKENHNAEVWGNISWDINGFEGMKPQVFHFDEVKLSEKENDTLMNRITNIFTK